MIKKLLVPILKICKSKFLKIEDPRFANREAEQIGTKLINWESVKNVHKPSSAEIFVREQKREKELADERERQHKQNIQEDKWEEVKLPEGSEKI